MKWFSLFRDADPAPQDRFVVYHVGPKPGFWQRLLNGLGIPTPAPQPVLVPVKPQRERQPN
ncbi:hypothetical protein [Acanthopleuribacter pedis]|uniref:Uncharacterized protein n=1 Tax=Acanthopleuribacter pedis TaxID=442870 RepID=A0A8J7Q7V0_9BACT|nr:hypothetical protein [Acanthopleuribacter pedis]MBO1322357.1 hypothetical protein [Acanthopleuribacter pedis]